MIYRLHNNTTVVANPDTQISNQSISDVNNSSEFDGPSVSSSNSQIPVSYAINAYENARSLNEDLSTDIQNSPDFTDKYLQCAECGGYYALGNVTKRLPDELICHERESIPSDGIDINYPWILSYDEVMYIHEHGRMVEVEQRIANHFNLTLDQYYDVTGLDGRERTAFLDQNGHIKYYSEDLHTGDVPSAFVVIPVDEYPTSDICDGGIDITIPVDEDAQADVNNESL